MAYSDGSVLAPYPVTKRTAGCAGTRPPRPERPAPAQIDVEHRPVAGFVARRLDRLGKARDRPHHDAAGSLQEILDQRRDQKFVLDDKYSQPLKSALS